MEKKKQISLSVVIPVYNEEGNIGSLFQETREVCETGMDGIPFDYEIIIVNDGSTDGTDRVCKSLRPLTYFRFRKNYGQTSALDCGFKAATKDYIAALDGDGQNDPRDIPMMIQYLLEHDLDVVSGWRRERYDPPGKRFASRGANLLRHLMIHDRIHDSGCTMKVYRRECFSDLNLYGEQHRFIPAILKTFGFRIGEVEVHHRARASGHTNYSFDRIIKGFLDLVSVWFWGKYSNRPLHLLGGISLVLFLLGFVCAVWGAGNILFGSVTYWPVISIILAVFFTVFGVLLLALGMISEMQMRSYYQITGKVPYTIREAAVYEEASEEPARSTDSDFEK